MRSCLFIDDEPFVLSAIGRLLRREPFALAFAAGPREALALCRHTSFDVVVSDFKMPEMDGAELLRAVRVIMPPSTRILLTGQSDSQSVARALCDGTIHRVIAKPFERATLVDALGQH